MFEYLWQKITKWSFVMAIVALEIQNHLKYLGVLVLESERFLDNERLLALERERDLDLDLLVICNE